MGVPLRVGLSVPSPRSFLAPGFPLQSLTQKINISSLRDFYMDDIRLILEIFCPYWTYK